MCAPSYFGSRGSYGSIVLGQSTLFKIYIYLRSSLRQVGSVAVARGIFLVGPGEILGARSLSHWTVREIPRSTIWISIRELIRSRLQLLTTSWVYAPGFHWNDAVKVTCKYVHLRPHEYIVLWTTVLIRDSWSQILVLWEPEMCIPLRKVSSVKIPLY